MCKKGFINIIIIGAIAIIIVAVGYFVLTRNTKAPVAIQEDETINDLTIKDWKIYKESYKNINFEFKLPPDWEILLEYPHYYKGFYENNPYTLQIYISPNNKQYSSLIDYLQEGDKTSQTAGGVGKILMQRSIMIDERPAIQRETMFSPGHDYLIYHIATYLLEKGTPILFNLAINRINEKKSDGIISVGDDITNKDRQFTNQILSTFKFIK